MPPSQYRPNDKMREVFQNKRPGDELSAALVNKLSRSARAAESSPIPASYVSGMHNSMGSGVLATGPGLPPRRLSIKTVNGDGTYKCYDRYYDEDLTTTLKWDKDDSSEVDLDATDAPMEYQKGDKVVAYWDGQRGMFIPIGTYGSWQGILGNNLVLTSASFGRVPIVTQFNRNSFLFDTTAPTDGYTVKLTKAGVYLFFICLEVTQPSSGYSYYLTGAEAYIEGVSGSTVREAPKSRLIGEWARTCANRATPMTRTFEVEVEENESFRMLIALSQSTNLDNAIILGGGAYKRYGSHWGIRYSGP